MCRRSDSSRVRTVALGVAFGGSGAAALLAEQGFEKLLGTLLGTSTPAGAVVLGTYFGGLTLGGWLYARRRGNVATSGAPALATYAKLEATIALACALLATFATGLVPLFAPVLRLGAASGAAMTVLRAVVAASWILPITIPMGATFPAIVDALDVVEERRRGAAVSAFYALNLAGAIAAAALGPYLIFPRLGIDGTLCVAALIDASAAGVAIEAARAFARVRREGTNENGHGRGHGHDVRGVKALLAVAGLSGFVLFSLEVVWIHLIAAVLGGSVYAFGTMLAVVLFGLGLGAAIGGAIGSRLGRVPSFFPGAALAIAAIALLLGHGQWPEAPHALAALGRDVHTFAEAERARASLAVKLLLGPATALGIVYPLMLRLDAFPREGAGPIAGRMGAVNALGCIAGALVTGFAGIPLLGGERMLLVLAGVCLVGAGVIAGARARVALPLSTTAAVAAFFLMPRWDLLHLTSGEHAYFERHHVFERTRLRYVHEDTYGGITTVVENDVRGAPMRVLLTNGKFQGNDGGEMAAQDGFALAPMLFVKHWDDALVIGLGTGRSASVVAAMGFGHVTIAELAPGIALAARHEFAHVNGRVLERANVRTVLDDARSSLLLDDRTYDLVTAEITSIWLAGETNVYS
ncbi:MAG: hypothetical protein JWP87_5179, partial [Labilithrix sp.]|nr:hypothetical protein [Labilithrix sp.]